MSRRIMDAKQERDVSLAYLCNVHPDDIESHYGVKVGTQRITANKRSLELEDPLIEFYRETDPDERLRNSAHLYLACNDVPVTNHNLIDKEKDSLVYTLLENGIYTPVFDEIINNTSLDKYLALAGNHLNLISMLFSSDNFERLGIRGYNFIEDTVFDRLTQEYFNPNTFSLVNVRRDVEERVIRDILNGGLSTTPLKEGILNDVLSTLTGKGEKVIRSLFGLGEKSKTLTQVGESLNVTRARVRQMHVKAMKQLGRPPRKCKLSILAKGIITDKEIEHYLAKQKTE